MRAFLQLRGCGPGHLNLLGFAFTFGIGTAWGVLQYKPEHFASTEPFLLLFFGLYLLLPLLYAAQTPGGARIDGSLLFGTPLIAFSLKSVAGRAHAAGTVCLGVGRDVCGAGMGADIKKSCNCWGVATRSWRWALLIFVDPAGVVCARHGLGVCQARLAWLGLTQQRRLPRWAGIGLQLAAALALVLAELSRLGYRNRGDQRQLYERAIDCRRRMCHGIEQLYRQHGNAMLAVLAYPGACRGGPAMASMKSTVSWHQRIACMPVCCWLALPAGWPQK